MDEMCSTPKTPYSQVTDNDLIDQYLAFIGLGDFSYSAMLETLKAIASAYVKSVPYQNTYLFEEGKKPSSERKPLSVAFNDCYQQIVIEKTPIYCYQNLELLFGILKQMGFDVLCLRMQPRKTKSIIAKSP